MRSLFDRSGSADVKSNDSSFSSRSPSFVKIRFESASSNWKSCSLQLENAYSSSNISTGFDLSYFTTLWTSLLKIWLIRWWSSWLSVSERSKNLNRMKIFFVFEEVQVCSPTSSKRWYPPVRIRMNIYSQVKDNENRNRVDRVVWTWSRKIDW